MQKRVEHKFLSLNHLTQIIQDWETVPLVDMRITSEKQCPESHPEEVFYKTWPGIYPTCDCQEKKDKSLKDFYVNERCP
jgi:hypothetical protein